MITLNAGQFIRVLSDNAVNAAYSSVTIDGATNSPVGIKTDSLVGLKGISTIVSTPSTGQKKRVDTLTLSGSGNVTVQVYDDVTATNLFRGNLTGYSGQDILTIDVDVAPEDNKVFARSIVKFATYGDSTGTYGDTQVMVVEGAPANNDTSQATAPQPVTTAANIVPSFEKFSLQLFYPMSRVVGNYGVSGRSCATMVTDETAASTVTTRKAYDTANNMPDVVIYSGGSINDLLAATYTSNTIDETEYQTLIANHKTCVRRLMSANSGLILDFGIYGYNGNDADAVGIRKALVRFNSEIKAWIESLGNDRILFIDTVGTISDGTGNFVPSMVNPADGVHLNFLGGMARDKLILSIIEKMFGKSQSYTHFGRNLQINPLFADTQALVGGTWPLNYLAPFITNGTATNGRIVQTEDGKVWAMSDVSATAAGDVICAQTIPFNPRAAGTNPLNVVANDIYGLECDILLSHPSGRIRGLATAEIKGTTYAVSNNGNTRVIVNPRSTVPPSTSYYYEGDFVAHLATPPWLFQESAALYGTSSTSSIAVTWNAVSAGEKVTFGFAAPRIVKLS